LAHRLLVEHDPRQVVLEDLLDRDALLARLQVKQRARLVRDLRQRRQLLPQLAFAGLNAGEVEDVVDDPQQVLPARMDVVEVVLVFGVADRPKHFAAHQFREPENGVERGSQLMAHVGEKLGFCHVGGFGAPPRLIRNCL
jgi:hypothetical protein